MATRADIRTDVDTLTGEDAQLSDATINTLIQLRFEHLYETFGFSRRLRDFTITLEAQTSSTSSTLATVTNGDATVTFAGSPITTAMDDEQIQIGDEIQSFFVNRTNAGEIELEDGEGTAVTWPGDSGGSQTWRVFKTIYALPSTALEVVSLAGEFPLEEFDGGRALLDQTDPNREQTSDHPKYWLYAGETSAGVKEIEVWPVPTQARILRGQFRRAAPTLSDATAVPMNRALLAYFTAADCLNHLHSKTGDEAYQTLALFYERKAQEVEKDVKVKEIELTSPASHLMRGTPGLRRQGTDWTVTHLDEVP